ncbi:MAG: hypothetical protein ACREYE_23255, partial [Gammaproteobacteria bacterium]
MAFVDVKGPPVPLFPIDGVSAAGPALLSVTLNNTAFGAGWVIEAPHTGTIKAIGFRNSAVSNQPDNGLQVAFSTLAVGFPSVETHFRILPQPFTANTWNTTGLITSDGTDTGTLKAVTRGDRFAITVSLESFVAGDNIQINIATTNSLAGYAAVGFPYPIQNVGAGWAKMGLSENLLNLGLLYDDDVWYPIINGMPFSGIATSTLNTGTNPDEYALQFQLPVPMRIAGAVFRATFADANADAVVRLYDEDTNVLATAGSLDSDLSGNTTQSGIFSVWFPTSVELDANTTYRLGVQGEGATSVTLSGLNLATAAIMNAVPGGGAYFAAQR